MPIISRCGVRPNGSADLEESTLVLLEEELGGGGAVVFLGSFETSQWAGLDWRWASGWRGWSVSTANESSNPLVQEVQSQFSLHEVNNIFQR